MKRRHETYTQRDRGVEYDIQDGKRIGEGIEGTVKRIVIDRPDGKGSLSGFVKKEFHLDDKEYRHGVEDGFLQAVENWKKIKEINQRRLKQGKEIFHLPTTVRPYIDEKGRCGFIMTDLSKEGTRNVLSLDTLHRKLFRNPQILTKEQWAIIRQVVEKDLQIAHEELIQLQAGDVGLDPWLIVIGPGEEVEIYLADVGRFITIGADPAAVEKTIQEQKGSLNALDKLIQGTISADQFWDHIM